MWDPDDHIFTVGENVIATTKIRNNYGAIQSFKLEKIPFLKGKKSYRILVVAIICSKKYLPLLSCRVKETSETVRLVIDEFTIGSK